MGEYDHLVRKDGKLKAKVKQRWVRALRSGNYLQTNEALGDWYYVGDEDSQGNEVKSAGYAFCCLGVFADQCDIVSRPGKYDNLLVDGDAGFLPTSIIPQEVQEDLACLNDDEKLSFEKIADYIEKDDRI